MAIDDQQPDQRDTPDTPGAPDDKKAATFPVRARMVLRVPPVWIFPLCIPAVLITVMTLIYIGSVLNPAAHLHGLPVMVVNQDSGAEVGGHHVDEGETVVNALTHTTAVSSRLGLRLTSLKEAEAVMNRGGAYADRRHPPDVHRLPPRRSRRGPDDDQFGSRPAGGATPRERSGRQSRSQPRRRRPHPGISFHLDPCRRDLVAQSSPTARATSYATAQLGDPIALTTTSYRPLPANTALGLSAFYVSLLAMMAGFLGATIINSSLDGALGYATTELGPRWKQRRPVPIERRQTLILKWTVALVAIPVLTATIVGVAAGILRMDAPHTALLWAVLTLAATMVAFMTLTLFAAFGSIGQLLAMLALVYLSLASSGGPSRPRPCPGSTTSSATSSRSARC